VSNAVCMYRTHLNPKGCVLQVEEDCSECGRRTPESGILAVCRVAAWLQERRSRAKQALRDCRGCGAATVEAVRARAEMALIDEALAVCRSVAKEVAGCGG